MDFIKSEPSSSSETCHTSSDSDSEMGRVKEEEDSTLQTFPTEISESEVHNDVCLCLLIMNIEGVPEGMCQVLGEYSLG